MSTAAEEACKAPRVIARISRRTDIPTVLVRTHRVAEQGEFRVNLAWERPLLAENTIEAQGFGLNDFPRAVTSPIGRGPQP